MSERSSAEVERDVVTKRRQVEETLEALRVKLSSGQIFGSLARSFTGAGGQGGELMTNLARQVRDNPLPVALTGVGLAWLLTSQYVARPVKPEDEESAAAPVEPPEPPELTLYDRIRYRADASAHGVEHAVKALLAGAYDLPAGASAVAEGGLDEARMEADERAHGAEHVLKELRAGAYRKRERIAATYDRAKILAEEARLGAAHVDDAHLGAGAPVAAAKSRDVGDRVQDFAGTALVAGRQIHRTLDDQVRAEPLMSGVVGVALGVILGALLPLPNGSDKR